MTPDRLIAGNRDHELIALVALIQSGKVPMAHLAGMVEHVGSAVRLLESSFATEPAGEDALALFDMVPPAAREGAAHEVASWAQYAYKVVSHLDDEYPHVLQSIFNRPPLLFVRGEAELLHADAGVAVVGTRKASPEGLRRAENLTRALAEDGRFVIVSGLAEGIDTVAHQTALRYNARTVAVMGTGLNSVYPAKNSQLAEDIVNAGGALVSQFFPSMRGTSWTFPMRNITMSGLSLATIVIEASETSGARMQARSALEHGRSVFLLRSLVKSHEWARKLVNEGLHGVRAHVLDDPSDVIDRMDSDYQPPAFATA
jgi:DNA processing protein